MGVSQSDVDTDMKSNFSDMRSDIKSYWTPHRCFTFAVLSSYTIMRYIKGNRDYESDSGVSKYKMQFCQLFERYGAANILSLRLLSNLHTVILETFMSL
jgi:hypothetical protein